MPQTTRNFRSLRCLYAFVILTLVSCTFAGGTEGPYDSSAILMRLRQLNRQVPIYTVPQNSKYGYLKPVLYYYDQVDTFGVVTYFVEDTNHQSVAKMRTGVLEPALDGAMSNSQVVSVNWADGSRASTCEPKVGLFSGDKIESLPNQTCLTWRAQGNSFLFFSSLGLNETLELVNAMEELK